MAVNLGLGLWAASLFGPHGDLRAIWGLGLSLGFGASGLGFGV